MKLKLPYKVLILVGGIGMVFSMIYAGGGVLPRVTINYGSTAGVEEVVEAHNTAAREAFNYFLAPDNVTIQDFLPGRNPNERHSLERFIGEVVYGAAETSALKRPIQNTNVGLLAQQFELFFDAVIEKNFRLISKEYVLILLQAFRGCMVSLLERHDITRSFSLPDRIEVADRLDFLLDYVYEQILLDKFATRSSFKANLQSGIKEEWKEKITEIRVELHQLLVPSPDFVTVRGKFTLADAERNLERAQELVSAAFNTLRERPFHEGTGRGVQRFDLRLPKPGKTFGWAGRMRPGFLNTYVGQIEEATRSLRLTTNVRGYPSELTAVFAQALHSIAPVVPQDVAFAVDGGALALQELEKFIFEALRNPEVGGALEEEELRRLGTHLTALIDYLFKEVLLKGELINEAFYYGLSHTSRLRIFRVWEAVAAEVKRNFQDRLGS